MSCSILGMPTASKNTTFKFVKRTHREAIRDRGPLHLFFSYFIQCKRVVLFSSQGETPHRRWGFWQGGPSVNNLNTMNFPQTVSLSPKQPKWQSFGKHLHAKQNSKLAKYAESANFAYLSKRTLTSFDLSKGPNQKTFRHKRHNKCKTNAKGLRPSKRSEPKDLRQ